MQRWEGQDKSEESWSIFSTAEKQFQVYETGSTEYRPEAKL